MELRILRYFLTVAREKNITKAASLLHITQPSLSRQLMQLEEELSVKLFERTRYGISLTEEGRFFLRRAEELLTLADKTGEELKGGLSALSGTVSIGCGETRNMEPLAQAIASFQEKYPEIHFVIETAVADEVKAKIESGILDFGLMIEPVDVSSFHFIWMPIVEKWCLLMRADSPLAVKEEITPKDLCGEKVILTKRPAVRNELENWFGEYMDRVHFCAVSNISYYNRTQMVRGGMGVSFTHEFSGFSADLCMRPLSPAIGNGSLFVWKKERPLSPAAEKFMEHLKMRFSYI